MKVAYLVSDMDHAHNYGLDFLYAGLVAELGFANVIDWPEKDCLHLPSIAERDACNIDSDQCFPRKASTWADVLACDLAIIANDPHGPDGTFMAARCSRLPRSMPIAAIDASDRVENCAAWYEAVAGRPLAAYFKREYPIGETWAKTYACPLSYPASRVPALEWEKKYPRVFYHATTHGGGAPGQPRMVIMDGLLNLQQPGYTDKLLDLSRQLPDFIGYGKFRSGGGKWSIWSEPDGYGVYKAGPQFDVTLMPSQEDRATPEQYHERMARALVGISYNGAANWDCNRFWENFAYGLCQVAERPTIQIPEPPLDGMHCFYVSKPEPVAPLVWALLNDEDRARQMAQDGHLHFLQHHSSEARARYVLKTLEAIG